MIIALGCFLILRTNAKIIFIYGFAAVSAVGLMYVTQQMEDKRLLVQTEIVADILDVPIEDVNYSYSTDSWYANDKAYKATFAGSMFLGYQLDFVTEIGPIIQ